MIDGPTVCSTRFARHPMIATTTVRLAGGVSHGGATETQDHRQRPRRAERFSKNGCRCLNGCAGSVAREIRRRIATCTSIRTLDLHFNQDCSESCCWVLLFLFRLPSDRGFAASVAAGVGVEVRAEETGSAEHLLGIILGSGDRSRKRGSFSEARQVFDLELLKPIIGELAKQARPLARDARRNDLTQRSPSGTAGPTRLLGCELS
jgi:hypothetical protein